MTRGSEIDSTTPSARGAATETIKVPKHSKAETYVDGKDEDEDEARRKKTAGASGAGAGAATKAPSGTGEGKVSVAGRRQKGNERHAKPSNRKR